MTKDTPWLGDACSLVDEFRAKRRSPLEELEATLDAISASSLNCFSYTDPDWARQKAKKADVKLPFGGVPVGIKELEWLQGWPATEGSLVFKNRRADHTATVVSRFMNSGAVPVGLTTASEFGGLNVSVTKLNGVTHNPWKHGKTVGGSSGGSASAVSGGLVSLASGGDGGGSIRIPAGYTGLFGIKGTYGRIARGPATFFVPGTVVLGCLARSVRDAARYWDATAGTDLRDPWSLPSHGNWEKGLGKNSLKGKKVGVVPDIGGAILEPGVEEHIREAARELIEAAGMVAVDIEINAPNLAAQWALGNSATLLAELGHLWPGCADELTDEVAAALRVAQGLYNLDVAAEAERRRIDTNDAMARAFEQVDFIFSATNPGPAFDAESSTSSTAPSVFSWLKKNSATRFAFKSAMTAASTVASFGPKLPNRLLDEVSERQPEMMAMGALTIISNVYGNPAASIPAGTMNGLPIGLQVLAPHHRDELVFDLALLAEKHMPWPLVAPTAS